MVTPPVPLQYARELNLCRYVHLTIQMTIPPSTGGTPAVYFNLPAEDLAGVSAEFEAINKIRVKVGPPPGQVWRTFALVWGEVTPAGITRDVIITHGQLGMKMHEDPWLHSLVDDEYPHSLTLTNQNPEVLVIENKTANAQTLDVTIHLMAFDTLDDYNKYLAMLVSQPSAPSGIPTAGLEAKLDEIIKEMKEGVRSVVTLWKQKV